MQILLEIMDKSTAVRKVGCTGGRSMRMREQSYYRFIDVEANNLCDESIPILVNCVGYAYMDRSFRTASVRKDYYLQFMDKGKLKIMIGGREEELLPGQFIIYEAGQHYEYSLDDGEMGYYWVHFTGSYVRELIRRAGLVYGRIYSAAEYTCRSFPALFSEFMIRGNGFEDTCGALLCILITELARMCSADDPVFTPDMKSRFVRSLSYIHNNYTEDIKVEELAALEHLSVSRYRDVFRRITGMSPISYIISLRMQRACELLASTDFTVTQIAPLCGYSDVLYFIRLFRQKMGVTPSAYRGK